MVSLKTHTPTLNYPIEKKPLLGNRTLGVSDSDGKRRLLSFRRSPHKTNRPTRPAGQRGSRCPPHHPPRPRRAPPEEPGFRGARRTCRQAGRERVFPSAASPELHASPPEHRARSPSQFTHRRPSSSDSQAEVSCPFKQDCRGHLSSSLT